MSLLVSTQQAADFLHVSIQTLYRWRKSGLLLPEGVDFRGRTAYTMAQLEAIRSRMVQPIMTREPPSKVTTSSPSAPTPLHLLPIAKDDPAPVKHLKTRWKNYPDYDQPTEPVSDLRLFTVEMDHAAKTIRYVPLAPELRPAAEFSDDERDAMFKALLD